MTTASVSGLIAAGILYTVLVYSNALYTSAKHFKFLKVCFTVIASLFFSGLLGMLVFYGVNFISGR